MDTAKMLVAFLVIGAAVVVVVTVVKSAPKA